MAHQHAVLPAHQELPPVLRTLKFSSNDAPKMDHMVQQAVRRHQNQYNNRKLMKCALSRSIRSKRFAGWIFHFLCSPASCCASLQSARSIVSSPSSRRKGKNTTCLAYESESGKKSCSRGLKVEESLIPYLQRTCRRLSTADNHRKPTDSFPSPARQIAEIFSQPCKCSAPTSGRYFQHHVQKKDSIRNMSERNSH